jgi:uncharacterized protein
LINSIGKVESLWRYPVKSMRGEEVVEIFVGYSGVFGDRVFAIRNENARKGFPYLNATTLPKMLLCEPRFRRREKTFQPPNWTEALGIAPGVTPSNAEPEDLMLDVVMPSGEVLGIDDPRLWETLGEDLRGENQLSIVRSDRALTDCRPVALISLQTIRQIETEVNLPLDKNRFRANIYFDCDLSDTFPEDHLIGRRLRIGERLELIILERDPRCKMISLDPQTGEHNPQILRSVAQNHSAQAGVYCAVLVEGMIGKNDEIYLLD